MWDVPKFHQGLRPLTYDLHALSLERPNRSSFLRLVLGLFHDRHKMHRNLRRIHSSRFSKGISISNKWNRCFGTLVPCRIHLAKYWTATGRVGPLRLHSSSKSMAFLSIQDASYAVSVCQVSALPSASFRSASRLAPLPLANRSP